MSRGPAEKHEPAGSAAPGARAILTSIGEVLYEWNLSDDTLRWGANALDVLKVQGFEAIATGRRYAALLAADSPPGRYDGILASGGLDQGSGVPYELLYCLKPEGPAGPALWIEDVGRWFADGRGRPCRAHGAIRVVNERHARDERLARLARLGELTGQLNRSELLEALRETLEAAWQSQQSCGFLLVGIDQLGSANDAYGFDIGDAVIAVVARRLRARLRGGDALGRFSGTKLGIVLRQCTEADMAVAAERFIAAVRDEVVVTALGPYAATITIGGVLAPRHGRTVEEILARAREALNDAKARRRSTFCAYVPSPARLEQRREVAALADEIVAALNERRVRLDVQPIVSAATGLPEFHEGLLRLLKRDGSEHPASAVVAVAQRVGLMRLLDVRVLELALKELGAYPEAVLSVNVSPMTIGDPTWLALLSASATRNPAVAARLVVEITESAAVEDLAETTRFIGACRALGSRVAIDDFGAGYTSFRTLRHLAVDFVKIDGTFIEGLATSEKDRVFVRTLVTLAQSLGARTIAEWVSDATSAALLTSWGVDLLQGHHCGAASPERPWDAAARKRKARL